MFRVKICGITTAKDAEMAASLGADAVGINFYRGSRRYVSPADAVSIVGAIRGKAVPVAVFVDETPEAIGEICRKLRIDTVQLSGNEPPVIAKRIALRRIKAIHLREGLEVGAFENYPCEAFLVDAESPGEFGGTGKTLEWGRIGGTKLRKQWILAGGLTPVNVLNAIHLARPYGVDVASGVEVQPGKKDPAKVRQFIINAMKGLCIERKYQEKK
ncbi:MAG: phosphoribosylanthranilate isomerase [Deltaproteobacteria bacterium]|nr:phosphoribosylanthranilate isomerase [Deltaproteobacteria bacterium]